MGLELGSLRYVTNHGTKNISFWRTESGVKLLLSCNDLRTAWK